ncbi:thiol reductant ABC exporter subunit CydC [Gordonia hydrophobica]|uniref:Thiol reductant ABC exporter subunit CydC n=1 Tax=Gordonia hydrophobica TaxID=40516 RepID=A0ABZ2U3J2_9ACTN|nr:thiol reductant ABC exporter subunit CydC [Gordonia hydrophobica]MBM7367855.1 ATP-binding cassette subfamily C protein CydC [Gordonia hydrophobica]
MHADRDPVVAVLAFTGLRWRGLVVPILLGVAGALSALGLAALSAWLITRAWQMPPVLYLSVAVTAVRALGISRGVFRYLERLATHNVALQAMADARTRLYRALSQGSAGFTVGLRQSEVMSRTADDVDEVGSAVIRGLLPMAIGAVTSLSAVVIMAVVSVPAAVILAVALLVSGVLAPWLAARGSSRKVADAARAREDVTDAASSLLWHGPELAVARARTGVLHAVAEADRRTERAEDAGMRWQAAAQAVTPLSMGVSVLAAALIAVQLSSGLSGSLADVSSGEAITPMLFGVLLLLPLSSFETTSPLTEAGIAWESGRQAARRILALVDGAQADGVEEADPVVDPRPVSLVADGLAWGWTDPLGTLAELRLVPGARQVVVGPSGVGKSTLLLTLAGLRAPLAGTVVVEGSRLRSSVCYFAEDAHVFSTTVRENLRVARGDVTDDEAVAVLTQVGLGEWLAGLPDGLDERLVGGAAALSGGQRRRLLLARALVHPAPVVLLDEPTEHLDAADADTLMSLICGDLFGDRTVVVVTHQDVSGVDVPVLELSR